MRLCPAIIVILSAGGLLHGETTTFSQDATVKTGDAYEIVVVEDTPPDRTSLEMLGGSIGWLQTHDQSTANVRGGWIFFGHAYGHSTINIHQIDELADLASFGSAVVNVYAGEVSDVRAAGSSRANIYGGYLPYTIRGDDVSTVSIFGGQIGRADLPEGLVLSTGTAIVNLYGGTLFGWLYADEQGIINVYGRDFQYDPTGGVVNQGLITGFWLDGSPLKLSIAQGLDDTYEHMRFLPEPTTALLAVVAFFLGSHSRSARRRGAA